MSPAALRVSKSSAAAASRVSSFWPSIDSTSIGLAAAGAARNSSTAAAVGSSALGRAFSAPIASVTAAFNSFGHSFRNSAFDA
jgi:hypothetical protein